MDSPAVGFVVDVVRHGDLLFAYFYGTTMNTLALGKEGTPGWISLLYDLLWILCDMEIFCLLTSMELILVALE